MQPAVRWWLWKLRLRCKLSACSTKLKTQRPACLGRRQFTKVREYGLRLFFNHFLCDSKWNQWDLMGMKFLIRGVQRKKYFRAKRIWAMLVLVIVKVCSALFTSSMWVYYDTQLVHLLSVILCGASGRSFPIFTTRFHAASWRVILSWRVCWWFSTSRVTVHLVSFLLFYGFQFHVTAEIARRFIAFTLYLFLSTRCNDHFILFRWIDIDGGHLTTWGGQFRDVL